MNESSQHEVRIGMAVFWVRLTPEANGFHFSSGDRVDGWSAGTKREVLTEARRLIQEREKRIDDEINGRSQ
jgi:hypothetical protein